METKHYLHSLTILNSLELKDLNLKEIEKLYYSLTPPTDQVNPRLYSKYIGREKESESLDRDRQIRQQYFLQQTEGLLDLPYSAVSYGTYFPSYQKALSEYKSAHLSSPNHSSLLVGAETKETIIEFDYLTKSTFPQAKSTVIDYQSFDTSPFHIPPQIDFIHRWIQLYNNRKNEHHPTFDSIHTNRLLPSYMTVHSFPWTVEPELYENLFKWLNPQGLLVMIEPIYDVSHLQGKTVSLEQIGFENIKIQKALALRGKREVDRWLNNIPLKHQIIKDPFQNFLITAQKTGKID